MPAEENDREVLLDLRGLALTVYSGDRALPLLRGVDLAIHRGEVIGLVGESGSGKSLTTLAVLGLLNRSITVERQGSAQFEGRDLFALTDRQMDSIRGKEIAMVFQDPMTALNPTKRVGDQVVESLTVHRGMSWREARAVAVDLFEQVGIPDAKRRSRQYPFQFSGGMRQRVMIAMALSCNPCLVFADEPTTGLDVTIQAQVLVLLESAVRDRGMSMVLISHDLGVVAEYTDTVAVMYAGRIVEYGPVEAVMTSPQHPYTQGLLNSIPRVDSDPDADLKSIRGTPPEPGSLPPGCPFAARCDFVHDACVVEPPLLELPGGTQAAACHLVRERLVTTAGRRG